MFNLFMRQKGTVAPHKSNYRFMRWASPFKHVPHVHAALNPFVRQGRYAASQVYCRNTVFNKFNQSQLTISVMCFKSLCIKWWYQPLQLFLFIWRSFYLQIKKTHTFIDIKLHYRNKKHNVTAVNIISQAHTQFGGVQRLV